MLISRLMNAAQGTETIDGMDDRTTPTRTLARRLAILRQDNHTNVRLSGADLVAFGRYPHSLGRLPHEDHVHVERSLDISSLRHSFINELSGEQKQRAFVAMVRCPDSDYILLDEPLNSLDLRHASAAMKILGRAAEKLGKTVVVDLHDINFASYYSDHIIAMRNGRVTKHGTSDEVIGASPVLSSATIWSPIT